jgi:hypothetical protein
MKKLLAVCLCLGVTLPLSACTPGEQISRLIQNDSSGEVETADTSPRVYMDELKGTLLDFTGDSLTLYTEEETYRFDVSQASLECQDGMITGDEVSVIYEGQLPESGNDTSSVSILKVVDDYHNKPPLTESVASGKVQSLTPNTVTLALDDGNTATYCITGSEEYYQAGIQKGQTLYIHYLGEYGSASADTPKVLNAAHVKVLSVSDTEPLSVPSPTPTPEAETEASKEQQMKVTIVTLETNLLTVLLADNTTTLSLDVSQIPCYFKGGAAPGSHATLRYTGTFNGSTLDGITLNSVTGEDPAKLKAKNISFTASGTIIASTANTVTIRTSDGADITCNTRDTTNTSTSGLEIGDGIKITFNPLDNKNTNIYTCLQIADS